MPPRRVAMCPGWRTTAPFTDFRLAVSAEGVHARYLIGIASGEGYDRAGEAVRLLVDRALSRLG